MSLEGYEVLTSVASLTANRSPVPCQRPARNPLRTTVVLCILAVASLFSCPAATHSASVAEGEGAAAMCLKCHGPSKNSPRSHPASSRRAGRRSPPIGTFPMTGKTSRIARAAIKRIRQTRPPVKLPPCPNRTSSPASNVTTKKIPAVQGLPQVSLL